ncbi:MAG: carboxypeptidase-like regulatory domain-containing protein, partial [bacterium]
MNKARYFLVSLVIVVMLVLAGAMIVLVRRASSSRSTIENGSVQESASSTLTAPSPRPETQTASSSGSTRSEDSAASPPAGIPQRNVEEPSSPTLSISLPRQTVVFRGIVLNTGNEPVGDAEVIVETLAHADHPSARRIQKTAPSGHFSFDDIPLPYLNALKVRHPDYASFERRYAAINNEPYAVRLSPPTMISGEVRREEILPEGAQLTVWLVGIEPAGGQHETTSLLLPLSSLQVRAGNPVQKIALAASEKMFEFRGFNPGWVKVAAEAPNGDRLETAPMLIRQG